MISRINENNHPGTFTRQALHISQRFLNLLDPVTVVKNLSGWVGECVENTSTVSRLILSSRCEQQHDLRLKTCEHRVLTRSFFSLDTQVHARARVCKQKLRLAS